MKTIAAAELLVYKPDNDSEDRADADYVVSGEDIASLNADERGHDLIDEGEIDLHGTWTDRITPGDRLVFRVAFEGTNAAYGTGTYGSGPYSTDLDERWTAWTRPTEYTELGRGETRTFLEAEDFVFGIMAHRDVFAEFEDVPISGSEDAILNSLLSDVAPEIGQDRIETVDTDVTVSWSGKPLIDCARDLADAGDALMGQRGTDLIFTTEEMLTPEFVVTDERSYGSGDGGAGDFGTPFTIRTDDGPLVNRLRTEGGIGIAEDDTQTDQTSVERVNNSNRLIYQLDTTKSTIPRVEIWTDRAGTGDNLVVRLQEDDGGSPRDVDNREADVARRQISSTFLASEGFTRFVMRPRKHSFYSPDPHLIIESDGEDGQDVGVNDAGEPTFRQYYAFPIGGIFDRPDSQNEFRRRDDTIKDESLDTRAEIEQRGNAVIRHRENPEKHARGPALSERAHKLRPLDMITIEKPQADFVDDAIVMERSQIFDGETNRLETTLRVQDVSSI